MAAFRKLWSTKHKLRILAIFLGVGLVYVLPFLAMPGFAAIFLQLDGIDGESTEINHLKWIELNSADWKVTRTAQYNAGSSTPTLSTPTVSPITVTKRMDRSTPLLFTESVMGKAKGGKIHFTRTGPMGEPITYYELTLYNVLVSSFAQNADSDQSNESVSLNFSKIEMKYHQISEKGTIGTTTTATYDITAGK